MLRSIVARLTECSLSPHKANGKSSHSYSRTGCHVSYPLGMSMSWAVKRKIRVCLLLARLEVSLYLWYKQGGVWISAYLVRIVTDRINQCWYLDPPNPCFRPVLVMVIEALAITLSICWWYTVSDSECFVQSRRLPWDLIHKQRLSFWSNICLLVWLLNSEALRNIVDGKYWRLFHHHIGG